MAGEHGSGGDKGGGSSTSPAYTDSGPWNGVAINLAGDTTPTVPFRGIWVGVAGNIVVKFVTSGDNITMVNVPIGYLVGHFATVYSSGAGTTASSLVGVW